MNLVRHNRGGADSIELLLERVPGRLTVRLQDFDVESPDMAEIERNRVATPSGGLGVHIARTLADSLAYEYDERTLTVTATMNLR